MKIDDIVARKSHNKDIIFKIISIENDIAVLKGIYVRLIATAPLSDLELVSEETLKRVSDENDSYYNHLINETKKNARHITGKILHLDSDSSYLKKCLKVYNDLDIYAHGVRLNEEDFSNEVIDLIKMIRPDIVILTGHDSFNRKEINDLGNYRNTKNYIKAILEIRKYYDKDDIFIFAGACQSNFEALIAAGANFASSPKRINIEAYDPAIIGVKASTTPFNKIISLKEVFLHTETGGDGISGIESYGKMRLLL